MAAKTTASWLKEAPLLLTRIPKLLAPFLLFAVIGILIPAVNKVYVNPLTAQMSRRYTQMEEHTDPSSAEYARLLEETWHDARELLLISIAGALVTLMLAFAKQIVACFFAACSTANSGSGGDSYSLAELLREATKWRNLKTSLVTTAVVVFVVQVVSMTLLGGNFATVLRDSGLLSVRGSLFLAAFLAFFYLGDLALMYVGVRSKEYSVLVLATLLLPALLIPVCAVAILYLYTEQVMRLGVSLLSVYDLLQAVQNLLYFSAANVYSYSYYYPAKAMEESKEMVVACNEEKMI